MSAWSAHVTVATLVRRDDRWLFVEERVNQSSVLNQPAGHWEEGESLVQAARRETLEETGWHVEPTALVGVYEHQPEHLGYTFVRFAFLADAVRHDAERPLDDGILRAVWLDRKELAAARGRHRSPMVERCIDDACRGQTFPLELIAHL